MHCLKKHGLHIFFILLQHFYFARLIMYVQSIQTTTAHEEEVKFTRCFRLKEWRERRVVAQGGAGWRRVFVGVDGWCHL